MEEELVPGPVHSDVLGNAGFVVPFVPGPFVLEVRIGDPVFATHIAEGIVVVESDHQGDVERGQIVPQVLDALEQEADAKPVHPGEAERTGGKPGAGDGCVADDPSVVACGGQDRRLIVDSQIVSKPDEGGGGLGHAELYPRPESAAAFSCIRAPVRAWAGSG